MQQRVRRKKSLTAEEKLRIVEEASSKATSDVEVCRRWGIEIWDLKRFRDQVRRGALSELSKKPGRPKQDERILELRADLERTEKALKELAIENTLLRGKVNGV